MKPELTIQHLKSALNINDAIIESTFIDIERMKYNDALSHPVHEKINKLIELEERRNKLLTIISKRRLEDRA